MIKAEALSSPMSSSAQLANYPKLALSGLHIPVDQASNTPRIQNELSSLNGHRAGKLASKQTNN